MRLRDEAGLALPFGAVGFAGTLLLLHGVGHDAVSPRDDLYARILVSCVTVTCLVLGWAMPSILERAERDSFLSLVAFGGVIAFAGLMCGMISGQFFAAASGASTPGPLGATVYTNDSMAGFGALGFVGSFAFFLPFGLIAHADRSIGRARAGSFVDDSDRRWVWVVTCFLIALSGSVVLTFPAPHSALVSSLAPVATVALALLVIRDVVARQQVRRAAQPVTPEDPEPLPESAPYRQSGRVEQVAPPYRGDPKVVDRVLARRIGMEGGLLFVCVLLLSFSKAGVIPRVVEGIREAVHLGS